MFVIRYGEHYVQRSIWKRGPLATAYRWETRLQVDLAVAVFSLPSGFIVERVEEPAQNLAAILAGYLSGGR
jgi:hypothetical protein